MPSIMPAVGAGGIVVRDAAGSTVTTTGVANAYLPPATFRMTCAETLFGNNCAVNRPDFDQLNAVASEMLALAVAMTPAGTWNCASVTNLSAAFTSWANAHSLGGAGGVSADPDNLLTVGGDGLPFLAPSLFMALDVAP